MGKHTENEQHQKSEENLFTKIWYGPDTAQSFPHGSLLSQNTADTTRRHSKLLCFLAIWPWYLLTFFVSSSLRLWFAVLLYRNYLYSTASGFNLRPCPGSKLMSAYGQGTIQYPITQNLH